MGILSFFRLVFQLFILASLSTWHRILRSFRRIRRTKRHDEETLPRYAPSTPVSSIQVPTPAAVIRLRSTLGEPLEQSNLQSDAPLSNDIPERSHPFPTAEPVTEAVGRKDQTSARSWTEIPLDMESGQMQDHLTSMSPAYCDIRRPPHAKPSLRSRLLKTSVPFSNSYPSCLDGLITNRSAHAKECGGYSDIYDATLHEQVIAVKVIRTFTSSSRKKLARCKLQKRVWREYLTWSSLCHTNVLPCLGFTFDFAYETSHQLPALVSPWMSNGTVLEYLHHHPSAKRMPLLLGMTDGLHYLHTRAKPVVHGDLRCSNILISAAGQPCLADFGLSRILNDTLGLTTSSDVAGSLRWMSPEILDGASVTRGSDAWAYGMTLLELFTEKRPYAHLSSEPAVLRHIIEGTLPPRPAPAPDLTDELWLLCMSCWKMEAKDRLTMVQAVQLLQKHRT